MKKTMEQLLDIVDWRESPRLPDGISSRTLPDGLPRVTHYGELDIMGTKLRCYRLDTGQVIFNADDVHEFFGEKLSANGRVKPDRSRRVRHARDREAGSA